MTEHAIHQPINAALMPNVAKLRIAQEQMKKLPQTYMPLRHYFGHGMYTRVMFAPADTAIIGKEHLHGQHNFLMHGSIKILTDEGAVILHAPEVIVSPPGTKRAAITLTDVIWATTLVTDLTDVNEIERTLIAPHDVAIPNTIEQETQP